MKVAIIGGGYAGFNLARLLDADVDVTLVEAREAFVHNVAAIRATVEPALLERIVIPYDRLLRRGQVIRGRVAGVDLSGIVLADGRHVPADAVVVATGSHYAAPFKPQGDSASDFADRLLAVSAQVASAGQLVIVGGGAVGVELAGEIKASYPTRQVALVADEARGAVDAVVGVSLLEQDSGLLSQGGSQEGGGKAEEGGQVFHRSVWGIRFFLGNKGRKERPFPGRRKRGNRAG